LSHSKFTLVYTQRTTTSTSNIKQFSLITSKTKLFLLPKMSLQEQPMQQQQQQQQQPVQVYPTTVTYQSPPEPDHHSSNGSFGSVFVVLAIIIIISAIACCLGRFCSRRGSGHSQKHVKQQKQQKQQNHHNSRPKEVDIEFGFDKKIAASKPMNNGHGHGGVRVQKPVADGHQDMKSFEIKLGPPQGKYRPGP
jgi:hypothetical protein